MKMNQEQENTFRCEGDVNFSSERKVWDHEISLTAARKTVSADSSYFLHQALSTPCLDALDRAKGIYLYAESGRKYMDFHGNNVHQLGYGNPYIVNRVKEQMDRLPFCPRRYTNAVAVECAFRLTELLPNDLNRVLFMPGGTLAVGAALKLARYVTGKFKIISTWDAFHGASLDAISVGGEAQFQQGMGALLPGVEHIPPYESKGVFIDKNPLLYADYLEYVLQKNGDVGAFIVETIRNTDVQIPPKAYWSRVREICDKYGVLLILDEIPTAFGRTGRMFTFEHYDIEPDILCLGKGLGGGLFPMAALVTREKYNVAAQVSLGHYTHEKSPLGCAATLGVLDYIRDFNLLEQVREKGEYFQSLLTKLKDKYSCIHEIRGLGLLWAIEILSLGTDVPDVNLVDRILYACLRNGLSFKVSKGYILQLSPPLIITKEELEEAVQILDKSIYESL